MRINKNSYLVLQLLIFSFPIHFSKLGISSLDIFLIIMTPFTLINFFCGNLKLKKELLFILLFIFIYFLLIGSIIINQYDNYEVILVTLRRLILPISILVAYQFLKKFDFALINFKVKFLYAIAPLLSISLSFLTSCSSTYSPICYFESSSYSASYLALGSFVMAVSIISFNKKKDGLLLKICYITYPILIISFFSRGSFLSLILIISFFILSKYKSLINSFFSFKVKNIKSFLIFTGTISFLLSLVIRKINFEEFNRISRIKDFLYSFSSPENLFIYISNTGRFLADNNENYFTKRFLDQCGNSIDNIILGCGNGIRYLQRGSWSSPSDYDSFWRLIFVDYGLIFTLVIGIFILYLQILAFKKLFGSTTKLNQKWLLSYFLSITLVALFTNEIFMMDAVGPQATFIVLLAFFKDKSLLSE
tara:strand:- start:122 stop:1384 length:1263 start_codon:yes stop_codon:yes gene_type:complete